MASGDELVIEFDCTQATEAIPQWAAEEGHAITDYQQIGDAAWSITVQKPDSTLSLRRTSGGGFKLDDLPRTRQSAFNRPLSLCHRHIVVPASAIHLHNPVKTLA